jgi:chromate reductase, NAD(P)H dehydrogenase (quinone)
MKVLAIPGSLRAASINAAFCRAAARLAPPPLQVSLFDGLRGLPLFDPDLEADPPGPVREFRAAVAEARALIIASPEYAHGVSGVMKNALDWLVSFEGFIDKPVAVVNTSARAKHADDALREVLRTMSARILPEASVTLPLLGSCTTDEAMVSSTEIAQQIRGALAALAAAVSGSGDSGPAFPIT